WSMCAIHSYRARRRVLPIHAVRGSDTPRADDGDRSSEEPDGGGVQEIADLLGCLAGERPGVGALEDDPEPVGGEHVEPVDVGGGPAGALGVAGHQLGLGGEVVDAGADRAL